MIMKSVVNSSASGVASQIPGFPNTKGSPKKHAVNRMNPRSKVMKVAYFARSTL